MITPSFNITAIERVLPKLALNFTTANLDARVTFTRTGNTATVINSLGYVTPINADLPRFDYDPVTLACKGLLIEEARTNDCIQSNAFDAVTAAWTTTAASITANAATSPDNTVSASKLYESATTATHYLQGTSRSYTSGTAYTFSIFAKAGERTVIQFVPLVRFPVAFVNFNLATGTIGTFSGVTFASITNVGDGWYRCSVTISANSTGSSAADSWIISNSASMVRFGSYAGNGASGLYIYGAQCEAGAFATSYIPTTTTALTRNADVAVMTGTDFSNWYSAGAGGVVARVLPSTVSGTRPALQFDDATTDEVITLRGNTTNPELVIVDGGSPQAQIDAGTIAANTTYNLGAAWNTDNCAAAVNGSAAVTDTTATIPTVTQARLGSDGTNYLNGHLQTLRYWPQRIINAEVQAFSK